MFIHRADKDKGMFTEQELWENPVRRFPPPVDMEAPLCTGLLLDVYPWLRMFARGPQRSLLLSEPFAQAARDFAWAERHHFTRGEYPVPESKGSYAPLYDLLLESYAGAMARTVERLARPAPGGKVMEVGCATGNLAVRLAPRVKEYKGLDHSLPFVLHAEGKARGMGLANCEFVAWNYPGRLMEESDLVLMFNVPPPVLDGAAPTAPRFLVSHFYGRVEPKAEEYRRSVEAFAGGEYRVERVEETWPELGSHIRVVSYLLERG